MIYWPSHYNTFGEHGDNYCWYAEIQEWFRSHGIPMSNIAWIGHVWTELEKNRLT